ncbi:asparagine synthase (glutamine-hydrolyzing) [Spirosoma sp. LMG 31447]|uniref:asparagine synthase (glutamine-hydrolyzing) n=1 Tax=Spirosoma utsteinense TaxID=2585773 RepID=A0ABR6W8C4_9BACT|nr:asparagine synthase (glutamine-hydrolyzing) [Spirosoma utsteinense]
MEADTDAALYAVADVTVFEPSSTESHFVGNYTLNGFSSFNQLNADFAVALWDARRQTLVCARDLLGVKPLYYVHRPGSFCAFATEIKALLAIGEVVVKPNQHKFREYLTWPKAYVPYSSETFYETIYSVLPGHYLQVSSRDSQVTAYWKPDLSRINGLIDADDYAALFREEFTEAVNARMLGKSQVGAHLSGGLDSSSVSCVAQHLLMAQGRPSVHTFNIDTGLASTDESVYVQEVIRQWNPVHHTVQPEPDVLASILEINRLFDRPEHFIIPSSFHLSVSIKARQIGCDCILTGHDGDSVITTGFDYLDQLIDRGDWDELQRACQQTVSQPNRNLTYVSDKWLSLSDRAKYEKYILYIVGAEVVSRFKGEPLTRFLHTLSSQKQRFNLSTTAILTYCIKRISDKIAHRVLIDSAFSPAFRQLSTPLLQPTTQGLNACLSPESPVPVSQIINTTNVICNEQLDHIGAYYGHQYSFPFFDKRVVEVGLATPAWVSFDEGRGRGLIRHGLQTVLPPAIVDRLTKANFVEYGNLSAQQLYQATHEQFALPGHEIWEVIDRPVFNEIVAIVFNSRIPIQQKTRYNWLLSRIIYLSLWLSTLSKGS